MLDAIKSYSEKGYISFHTPCHKGRNKYLNNLLNSSFDLTELDETDNLFFEEGCIKDFEEKMAQSLGGKFFYPLVNGATSGVMASLSVFDENDKIIVDRNCHISVINAIILNKLNPVFIDTALNEFNLPLPPSAENVKEAYLNNPDAKGIFVTNPNYYGMWAELKEIIEFAKENNLISIVDEAHGSHYYYMDKSRTGAGHGADLSILSFHKNLPCLTQTGGILINNAGLKEKLKNSLRNFTSTSPSYIFMISMDGMHRYMETEGAIKLSEYYSYLEKIKKSLKNKGVKILDLNDPFKFVINSKNAKLKALKIKEKYKIVPEMCDNENVTYIISIHNYKKEINLLSEAILEFLYDEGFLNKKFSMPKKALLPYEALQCAFEEVEVEKSVGRISCETVIDFPPSVPVVVAGEIINEETIKFINKEKIRCVRK